MRSSLNIALALSLFFFGAACTKTKHGACPEPRENVEWFFIVEKGIGTQSKCILCDTSEDSTEAESCLYVYTENQTNWEDLEQCRLEACSVDPNTHDSVKDGHGAWGVIQPILNGEITGDERTGTVFSMANTNPNILKRKPVCSASRSMNALLDPKFYAQPNDSSLID